MNKLPIICALAAVAAFPQAQTPLVITQSAGSATGELRMQERRTNGTNYVGIKAPQSVAANTVWTLPSSDGTSGQCLQTDGAGQWQWSACTNTRLVSDYDWTKVVGARSGSGALTLTFTGTSCPAAGADSAYVFRLYETSTPTTYELATSNGTGTCTRGGAGTIVATGPTGTYTNATATSASSGWQEAMFSVADSLPVYLRARMGGYYIYTDILTEDRVAAIECEGPGAVLVPMVNNVKVFNVASPSAARISGCKISNAYAKTGITAVYFNNPDGDTFGGLVQGLEIYDVENGIHGVTWYAIDAIGNLIVNPSNAGIWIENVSTGDAGAGVIERNKLSCSSTCTYGVLWNGPGAVEIKNNPINGFTNQVYLEPLHGYASAANSGANTVLTWVSGNRFRAAMVGKSVHVGTASCTVSTYTSSTSMTCNGVNLGTIASSRYYAGTSGQAQVIGNLLDGGNNTTYGVRWVGEISFTNAQIEDNFIANYAVNSAKGVSLEGSGLAIATVKHNNIQGGPSLTGTVGVNVTAGGQYHVSDNQVSGYQTAVNIGGSVLYATSENNRCVSFGTACVANAASTVTLRENGPFTFALLPSSIADGSVLYCSNCKPTSAASRTCSGSGTGATATRLNGAWKCEDGSSSSQWTTSGSDIYRSSKVGIGAAPVVGTQLSISGGSGVNTLYISDSSAANAFQLNVASSYTFIGNYSATPIIFGANSTARWRLTSAGMFQPEATDTYDIGVLSGARVRGVYSKIIDTALSGGTGDYLQTRKIQLFDNTGSSTGASYWDFNVVMSGVGAGQNSYFYLRDNGGNTVWRADKIASGAAVATTTIYTDLLPDSTANVRKLGKTTQRWDEINGASLDLSGAANITGNLSAAIINATGSPAYRVAGTTVINASRAATFTDLTINTASAPTVGYVWTATSTGGAGSWQASASSAPFIDSTAIIKGSGDATKLLKIEVDGFTTATTRTITPQNASYTIAGIDIAQTFTQTQTLNGSTALVINGTITGDLLFTSANTYIVGNSTNYLNNVHSSTFTTYGQIKPGSGVTTADLGGSTVPFRKLYIGDISFTGAMTPPSGSAFTGTKTVRASGGLSDCTLTFSAGIMTGGTC
ncbi:hypothetical protein UFOVP836_51 [uncultured Caudovirales phage]|uniref:Uncharacterized protein n=1 Tax=uncultured Caudovirales phage TaxID=2100421 RepID=A0A6J5P9T4_9CAUD|nr:hypothetical protein UFOVP836_51 [uncultured Caudovirales phage]